jgi:hypothetical protein
MNDKEHEPMSTIRADARPSSRMMLAAVASDYAVCSKA